MNEWVGRQTRDQRRGVQKKCVGVEVGVWRAWSHIFPLFVTPYPSPLPSLLCVSLPLFCICTYYPHLLLLLLLLLLLYRQSTREQVSTILSWTSPTLWVIFQCRYFYKPWYIVTWRVLGLQRFGCSQEKYICTTGTYPTGEVPNLVTVMVYQLPSLRCKN